MPISNRQSILEKKEKEYAGTASILWVDDEEMIRKFGEKMLKILGHTGDFAVNSKEALEFLVKGNKYDLIINDNGMSTLKYRRNSNVFFPKKQFSKIFQTGILYTLQFARHQTINHPAIR